jgi:hypothetical protein
MPMPSLFRYFVVVGAVLTGLLFLANHLLAPDGAPVKAAAAAKPQQIAIQHDPRASLIERLRLEEAARQAAERGTPVPATAVAAASSEPVPVNEPSPTRPETPQLTAPVSLVTAPPTEPDRSAEETRKAEQLKAEQARRAHIARERARAKRREEAAVRQPDQFFYGYGGYATREPAPAPTFGWSRTW